MIAIRTRKRKGGVKEWLRIDPSNVTRISLGEEKFEKIVSSHGADIVRYEICYLRMKFFWHCGLKKPLD